MAMNNCGVAMKMLVVEHMRRAASMHASIPLPASSQDKPVKSQAVEIPSSATNSTPRHIGLGLKEVQYKMACDKGEVGSQRANLQERETLQHQDNLLRMLNSRLDRRILHRRCRS